MAPKTSTTDPHELLLSHFGFESFRPGQLEIIQSVLQGHDTLVVMPTGGGKSLCYQIPALALPGITIVVSPLIALMKDQVDALGRRGIGATTINSTIPFHEVRQRLIDLRYGKYKLLYIAPERFESTRFLEMLENIEISLFAVDEAHCISEWGHDFRPSYLRLNQSLESVGRPTVIALTATATPFVQEDIVRQLELRRLRRFVKGFDRPNLTWEVRASNDKSRDLRSLVKQDLAHGGVAIAYCGTRKRVKQMTSTLEAENVPVAMYHAGLETSERRAAQEAFIAGDIRVIVATNAFGMGIDKPDVRAVYHLDMPGSVESYYQEAGRAGRDGKPSRCVLIWSGRDRSLQEFFIRMSFPEREVVESVYNALWDSVQGALGSSYEGIIVPNEKRIATRARVHPAVVRGGLSILEKSEYIELVRSENLALVRFVSPASEIKRFYAVTQDRIRKQTLMGLLRAIGGAALTHETMIKPDTVARKCDLTPEEFEDGMKSLTMSRLLVYTPPSRQGGVRFLTERVPSRELRLDFAGIEKDRARSVARLDAMERYAMTGMCRRDFILEYFGADLEKEPCGRCDNCLGEYNVSSPRTTGKGRERFTHRPHLHPNGRSRPGSVDTDLEKQFLMAVYELGERFGKMTVVDFLIGNSNSTINSFGLDTHPRYGSLRDVDRRELARTADMMFGGGLLRKTAGMKPVVKLTEKGRGSIDRSEATPFTPSKKKPDHALHPELLVKLRSMRDMIADRDAYTRNEVCPDQVLLRIANKVPFNRSELLRIAGYNQSLYDRCGTSILQTLEDYRESLDESSRSLTLPSRLRVTYELAGQGYEMDQIASMTARQPSTISNHISELIELNAIDDIEQFVASGVIRRVDEALADHPNATLSELRMLTGGGIPFPELRIASTWVQSGKHSAVK